MTARSSSKSPPQFYKEVFEFAPFGIYTLDKDGYITSFNPKMQQLSGDTPEEAIGLNALELKTYKDVGLDQHFKRAIKEGKPFEKEVRYLSYVGKKLSIRHYRGIPIKKGKRHSSTRVLLIVEDVTEKRQTEARLEEALQEERLEHQRLRTLINSIGDAVVATDQKGAIIDYNGATLELFDTNESLQGQQIKKFLKTYTNAKKPIDLLEEARRQHRATKREDILFQVGEQDYINLYINISPIYSSYGTRSESGFLFLLRDITKEKSVEAQRDEFVSVTSHELRTPVAVAEASISTAMLPAILKQPKQAARLLNQAHKNVLFLGNLIADLTTLANAERGLLDIDITMVDPNKIAKQIKSNNLQTATKKGLKLLVSVSGKAEPISSSEYHILEILQNLVDNSLKYTASGSIEVDIEPSQNYKKGLKFIVSDTGIGISVHDKKKVFEKFFRSEDYRTRETGGTGLGLYVSKRLAGRLGGTLTLDSALNKGSCFYLEIPEVRKRKSSKKQQES